MAGNNKNSGLSFSLLLFSGATYAFCSHNLHALKRLCADSGFDWPVALTTLGTLLLWISLEGLALLKCFNPAADVPLRRVLVLSVTQAIVACTVVGLAGKLSSGTAAATVLGIDPSTAAAEGPPSSVDEFEATLLPILVIPCTIFLQTIFTGRDEYLEDSNLPQIGIGSAHKRLRDRSWVCRTGLFLLYVLLPRLCDVAVGTLSAAILTIYHAFRVVYCGGRTVFLILHVVYRIVSCPFQFFCKLCCGRKEGADETTMEETAMLVPGGGGADVVGKKTDRDVDVENQPGGPGTARNKSAQDQVEMTPVARRKSSNNLSVDKTSPKIDIVVKTPDQESDRSSSVSQTRSRRNLLDVSGELDLPPPISHMTPRSVASRLKFPTFCELVALSVVCVPLVLKLVQQLVPLIATMVPAAAGNEGAGAPASSTTAQENSNTDGTQLSASLSRTSFSSFLTDLLLTLASQKGLTRTVVIAFLVALNGLWIHRAEIQLEVTAMQLLHLVSRTSFWILLLVAIPFTEGHLLSIQEQEKLLTQAQELWSSATQERNWRTVSSMFDKDNYGKYLLRRILQADTTSLENGGGAAALDTTALPLAAAQPMREELSNTVLASDQQQAWLFLPHTWVSIRSFSTVALFCANFAGMQWAAVTFLMKGAPLSFQVLDRGTTSVAAVMVLAAKEHFACLVAAVWYGLLRLNSNRKVK
ncbi:unnamed protein product [Amoebophrya sp. A120]|nr:unnamed protein product [Amoebophrya sp. A120]|eukprot:GSA120T00018688001.1